MLTRPGSTPGSGWMRNLSERLSSGPPDTRSLPRAFWIAYTIFMVLFLGVLPWTQHRFRPLSSYTRYNGRTYESAARIGGLPLFAAGPAPAAIIAVGGRPRGVIAVGGLPLGVIAVGGVAVGGLAIGGVSLGFLALAGLAIGWRAAGGVAIGYRAFGGLAVGGYAYAGNGVAYGYYEASGRQKEKLFG
jgi:hypothetical protein